MKLIPMMEEDKSEVEQVFCIYLINFEYVYRNGSMFDKNAWKEVEP